MVRGVFVISKPAMVSSGEKLVLDGLELRITTG